MSIFKQDKDSDDKDRKTAAAAQAHGADRKAMSRRGAARVDRNESIYKVAMDAQGKQNRLNQTAAATGQRPGQGAHGPGGNQGQMIQPGAGTPGMEGRSTPHLAINADGGAPVRNAPRTGGISGGAGNLRMPAGYGKSHDASTSLAREAGGAAGSGPMSSGQSSAQDNGKDSKESKDSSKRD